MIKTKLITVKPRKFSYEDGKLLDELINEFLSSNDKYDHLIDIKYQTAIDLIQGTTYGVIHSALIIYNEVEK